MTIRRNAKAGEQVRYIGANIGYIPGIPMKDMDDAEWNALDGDLRETGIKSGMYALSDQGDAAPEVALDAQPAKGKTAPAPKAEQNTKEGG